MTLAQGGGGSSAGDNQYVNPLGGSNSGSGSSSGNSGGSHSSGSSGSSSSGSSGSSNSSSGSGQSRPPRRPPARRRPGLGPHRHLVELGQRLERADGHHGVGPEHHQLVGLVQTLPYTGFSDGLAAAFGLALLAGGLLLRRRVQRS